MVGEFRSFLLKTNALALAIGVIIGTALGTVVSSLLALALAVPFGCLTRKNGPVNAPRPGYFAGLASHGFVAPLAVNASPAATSGPKAAMASRRFDARMARSLTTT